MATLIDADHPPRPEDARALLDDCAEQFATLLTGAARASIESADDLFETGHEVSDEDSLHFLHHRGDWLERFERTLRELVARRLDGKRRKGRRPDSDVSASTLRVLSAYDHERQVAIVRASDALASAARRETAALDQRVDLLLSERAGAGVDNPFGIAYLLDAIGASSRATYPNPRIWRPLMERLLDDLRPAVVKTFITLNRGLADRGVLPEIKASLRARSALRPADDSELLPLFEKMLHDTELPAIAEPIEVSVPSVDELATDQPALVFVDHGAVPRVAPPTDGAATPTVAMPAAAPPALPPVTEEVARALYAAYARYLDRIAAAAPVAAAPVVNDGLDFPTLDSMMALGGASAIIAELDQWQRFDPERELAADGEASAIGESPQLPLNRIPLIRNALAAKITNPADRMTMDVVALIFDYIFRDPSIPDAQRRIFSRLQVPIAKAALLDRTFFTDRHHPARRLLDNLAAAAVGAQGNADYQQAFEAMAGDVVDHVTADFGVDLTAFEAADARIRPFVLGEQASAAGALQDDIGSALASEASDAHGAEVRALLRDRLAGLDIPFDVRSFTETLWADHLTAIRANEGKESEAWQTAMATLDDLLWSIAAKERNAQKAKLTRLIPSLVRRLRSGLGTLGAAGERIGGFFESLYKLHIDVLRPPAPAATPADESPSPSNVATAASLAKRAKARSEPLPQPKPAASAAKAAFDPTTVHDFVAEMAIGTWLLFRDDENETPARLFWVSPLRTRYIFTARGRSRALSFKPEELAWQLGAGRATLIVEPVPLFDRAVSAALDTLAAHAPAAAGR